MNDAGGKRRRGFVERREQRQRRVQIFLAQRKPARRLRLGDFAPEFRLLGDQEFVQPVKLRDERLLLRELDARKQVQRPRQRRHLVGAQIAQILLRIMVHRLLGGESPVGVGPIGAQIVHRFEQVRRRIRDQRHAIGCLQALPGVPCAERDRDDHAKRSGHDDGLQQRGHGQAIQHEGPQGRWQPFGP